MRLGFQRGCNVVQRNGGKVMYFACLVPPSKSKLAQHQLSFLQPMVFLKTCAFLEHVLPVLMSNYWEWLWALTFTYVTLGLQTMSERVHTGTDIAKLAARGGNGAPL